MKFPNNFYASTDLEKEFDAMITRACPFIGYGRAIQLVQMQYAEMLELAGSSPSLALSGSFFNPEDVKSLTRFQKEGES